MHLRCDAARKTRPNALLSNVKTAAIGLTEFIPMMPLDQIRALIGGRSPKPICDDCIAVILRLASKGHATKLAIALGKVSGFSRNKDSCSVCGDVKMVVQTAVPS